MPRPTNVKTRPKLPIPDEDPYSIAGNTRIAATDASDSSGYSGGSGSGNSGGSNGNNGGVDSINNNIGGGKYLYINKINYYKTRNIMLCLYVPYLCKMCFLLFFLCFNFTCFAVGRLLFRLCVCVYICVEMRRTRKRLDGNA